MEGDWPENEMQYVGGRHGRFSRASMVLRRRKLTLSGLEMARERDEGWSSDLALPLVGCVILRQ